MNTSITNISNKRSNLSDHKILAKNNISLEFKQDANGEATNTQENHYYPFGMRFSGEVFANNDNDFRYNGKELQDDFDLDWPRFQRDCMSLRIDFTKARQSQAPGEYDYGARFYDPALGRWHVVDPLANKAPGWTPYRYGFNNPMSFIDPDGRAEQEQSRESQQDIPWKAKNYSSFSIEGVGGLSASNPEISVILDFYDAISGAYIGSVEASEEGETATGSDEPDEGEEAGKSENSRDVASSGGGDPGLALANAFNSMPPILPGLGSIHIINPFYGAAAISIDGGGNFVGAEADKGIILMLRGKDIGKYVTYNEIAGGGGTGASIGGEITRFDFTGGNDNLRLSYLEGFRSKAYVGGNVYGFFGIGIAATWSKPVNGYRVTGTTFSFGLGLSPFLIDAGFNQGDVKFDK